MAYLNVLILFWILQTFNDPFRMLLHLNISDVMCFNELISPLPI